MGSDEAPSLKIALSLTKLNWGLELCSLVASLRSCGGSSAASFGRYPASCIEEREARSPLVPCSRALGLLNFHAAIHGDPLSNLAHAVVVQRNVRMVTFRAGGPRGPIRLMLYLCSLCCAQARIIRDQLITPSTACLSGIQTKLCSIHYPLSSPDRSTWKNSSQFIPLVVPTLLLGITPALGSP